MGEEKEIITAEEQEESGVAEESSAAEEYFAEEPIELGEMSPSEIDLMLKKSEIWDKLVRGKISVDKARELFNEISPPATEVRRRRRRRRSRRR